VIRTSLITWAVTAALAGFLFGFDTAVISGAEQAVQQEWSMSDALHGLAISSALWGTVIGALCGGRVSDAYGRKPVLIGIGVLYLVSAVGSALAWDANSFILFRFIGGIGVGASSVAAPTYISEIATRQWRGRLVALFQMMLVLGILVAFLSNYFMVGLGENSWRWMLAAETVPAALYLTAVLIIPESPRWLALKRGQFDTARAILEKINPATAEATLQDVTETQDAAMSLKRFFSGPLNKPILLAFLLAAFNQLSGINVIIYFAPRIFELTGGSESAALLATTGIGIANLLFTIIGLALIDKMGRKGLMYIGSLGYIVSLAVVAFGFSTKQFDLVPIFIFAFIAAHAVGQGAVIWVYIAEIFPNNARGTGQSFGTGVHWVLAASLTLIMPAVLTNVAPEIIFSVFAGLMVLQLLFTHFLMIETRGRSLEELSKELVREI